MLRSAVLPPTDAPASASAKPTARRAPTFSVLADVSARRLQVTGEFDVAVVGSFAAATGLVTGHPGDVVLDLAAITFIDASGLGAIVRLRNTLGCDGHTLRFDEVPAGVRRVFTAGGLAELLPATGHRLTVAPRNTVSGRVTAPGKFPV